MSDYSRLRTPFTSMSFTPDVPSNALGPNEYNSGKNVEADVRCIKKIFGEIQIASTITDMPIFMEGGFRSETSWVYIVATRNSSSQGNMHAKLRISTTILIKQAAYTFFLLKKINFLR